MSMKQIAIAGSVVVAVGILMASVTRQSRSTSSACAAALGSEVCVWVVMEGESAVELGATIPMSLIEAVPSDAPMVWPPEPLLALELPGEGREALGIEHMVINWEPHGHPPQTFLAPHFDFHFYNISRAEVKAIDCSDESKPSNLPARYALPDVDVPGLGMLVGLCVPQMGMHAMRAQEAEEADAFQASMMMGYYGGAPVFFEPMVSRDRLLERSGFALPMPAMEDLPTGVRYPTEFRADYVAGEDHYRLLFSGFESP